MRRLLTLALSRAAHLGGLQVWERSGGDDLPDGAMCRIVNEAGYDEVIWQTWCPAEPLNVVSHALDRVLYCHGPSDLVWFDPEPVCECLLCFGIHESGHPTVGVMEDDKLQCHRHVRGKSGREAFP